MTSFGITTIVIGALALIFALWVKPTNTHHNTTK